MVVCSCDYDMAICRNLAFPKRRLMVGLAMQLIAVGLANAAQDREVVLLERTNEELVLVEGEVDSKVTTYPNGLVCLIRPNENGRQHKQKVVVHPRRSLSQMWRGHKAGRRWSDPMQTPSPSNLDVDVGPSETLFCVECPSAAYE